MKVNANKTKVVIFSEGKIRKKPKFKFGDTNIEIVDDCILIQGLPLTTIIDFLKL